MYRMPKMIALGALSLVLSLTVAGPLAAKSETVKMTITAPDLPKPIEVTDTSILRRLNVWSGPGNFSVDNGVKIPAMYDGSILWSLGVVPDAPKGLAQYEVSLYGRMPQERVIYMFRYQYDPKEKKGYIYLPGRGEKGYDIDVRSIYRGVEGHWFRASEAFDDAVEPLIGKALAAGEVIH